MLETATQVMIMSCLWPFSSGNGKPWRWPWTTGALLKQNKTTQQKKQGGKKPVYIPCEYSHSAFSVQGNKSCSYLRQHITPAHSYEGVPYKTQNCGLFLFLARNLDAEGDKSHLLDSHQLLSHILLDKLV